MKSVIDKYIETVKAFNSLELSILEKHRWVTGLLLVVAIVTVLASILGVIHLQLNIHNLLNTPQEVTVLN